MDVSSSTNEKIDRLQDSVNLILAKLSRERANCCCIEKDECNGTNDGKPMTPDIRKMASPEPAVRAGADSQRCMRELGFPVTKSAEEVSEMVCVSSQWRI